MVSVIGAEILDEVIGSTQEESFAQDILREYIGFCSLGATLRIRGLCDDTVGTLSNHLRKKEEGLSSGDIQLINQRCWLIAHRLRG